jgi:hypothetical protein
LIANVGYVNSTKTLDSECRLCEQHEETTDRPTDRPTDLRRPNFGEKRVLKGPPPPAAAAAVVVVVVVVVTVVVVVVGAEAAVVVA